MGVEIDKANFEALLDARKEENGVSLRMRVRPQRSQSCTHWAWGSRKAPQTYEAAQKPPGGRSAAYAHKTDAQHQTPSGLFSRKPRPPFLNRLQFADGFWSYAQDTTGYSFFSHPSVQHPDSFKISFLLAIIISREK